MKWCQLFRCCQGEVFVGWACVRVTGMGCQMVSCVPSIKRELSTPGVLFPALTLPFDTKTIISFSFRAHHCGSLSDFSLLPQSTCTTNVLYVSFIS